MKTKRKVSKLFTILLSLVMLVGLNSTTVFAGVSGHPSLPSVGIGQNELQSGVYYLYQDSKLTMDGATAENYQVYYDSNASKLVLNNAALTDFVLVPGGTTVEILGTNSIAGAVGIQSTSNGDITVTGEGSLAIDSDTEGILIDSAYSGNIELTGNIAVAMNCKAYAINNTQKNGGGNIAISGNVTMMSSGSQPAISSDNGDIVICDETDIQSAGDISTTWGDIVIRDTAKVSVETTGIAICGSYGDKIEITDQAQVTAIGSAGICKFKGDLLVGKDATLSATCRARNGAAINMGANYTGEDDSQTVELKGTVNVKGFVGIGTTNADSSILLNGGHIHVESDLVGLYPTGGGTVQIINGSDVSIESKQYGIVLKSGAPIITDSTIEISAGTGAFNAPEAPVLTYDTCQTITIGENKDGAETVRKDDLPDDFAKNKYIRFAPSEHTGGTATCMDKAVCINCSKEYGELEDHVMLHHPAVAGTCAVPGSVEYWHCSECDKNYDSATGGNVLTTVETVIDSNNHSNILHIEANAPACDAAGNTEHWHCEGCDKYFSDETGTIEIDLETTVISKTGHGETEIKNARTATCTEKGYTGDKICKDCGEVVEKGKTIAKIAHTYKDGKCTVCGAADPDYKPNEANPDSPQTGDSSNIWMWAAVFFAVSGGLIGTTVYGKKRKNTLNKS